MSHVYAVTGSSSEEWYLFACFSTLEKAEEWLAKYPGKSDTPRMIVANPLDPETDQIADRKADCWSSSVDFKTGKITSREKRQDSNFVKRGWTRTNSVHRVAVSGEAFSTISQAHADKLATDLWAQVMLDNPDIEERWEKVGR